MVRQHKYWLFRHGLLEGIEGLLSPFRPFPLGSLLEQISEWYDNGGITSNEPPIIVGKA